MTKWTIHCLLAPKGSQQPCMHKYVCICECTNMCAYVHAQCSHKYMHICAHICACIHVCPHMWTCVFICLLHMCIGALYYISTYIFMYCALTYTNACVYHIYHVPHICSYLCVHAYMLQGQPYKYSCVCSREDSTYMHVFVPETILHVHQRRPWQSR